MIENFNLNNWPIVYFSNNSDKCMTDESFEEFKEYYLNLLVRCKRTKDKMILICNLNNVTDNSPSLKYIMRFAQFNKSIYKFNKEYVGGVCLLSTNKCLKDLLQIYFSVAKPACPVKICRSIEKANKFLKEKCDLIINVNTIIINSNIDSDVNMDFIKSESPINDDDSEEFYESNSGKINNDEIEPEFDKDKYSALL